MKVSNVRMKGQYLSFDAMVSSIMFILAIVSLLSYWHSVRLTVDNQNEELLKDAFKVSELLLSPGYPFDKDCNDMVEVGFAISSKDKRLNNTKIKCLAAISKDELNARLGTTNKVFIEIKSYEGSYSEMIPNEAPNSDEIANSARVRRIVSILNENGEDEIPAYLDVLVYQMK